MNWVGGARSRLRQQNEKKTQQEFFARQRLKRETATAQRSLRSGSPEGSLEKPLSLDLISLQIIQQASAKRNEARSHGGTNEHLLKRNLNLSGKHQLGFKKLGKNVNIPLQLPMSPIHHPSTLDLEASLFEDVPQPYKQPFQSVLPGGGPADLSSEDPFGSSRRRRSLAPNSPSESKGMQLTAEDPLHSAACLKAKESKLYQNREMKLGKIPSKQTKRDVSHINELKDGLKYDGTKNDWKIDPANFGLDRDSLDRRVPQQRPTIQLACNSLSSTGLTSETPLPQGMKRHNMLTSETPLPKHIKKHVDNMWGKEKRRNRTERQSCESATVIPKSKHPMAETKNQGFCSFEKMMMSIKEGAPQQNMITESTPILDSQTATDGNVKKSKNSWFNFISKQTIAHSLEEREDAVYNERDLNPIKDASLSLSSVLGEEPVTRPRDGNMKKAYKVNVHCMQEAKPNCHSKRDLYCSALEELMQLGKGLDEGEGLAATQESSSIGDKDEEDLQCLENFDSISITTDDDSQDQPEKQACAGSHLGRSHEVPVHQLQKYIEGIRGVLESESAKEDEYTVQLADSVLPVPTTGTPPLNIHTQPESQTAHLDNAAQQGNPIAQSDNPIAQSDNPIAQSDNLIAQSDNSIAQSDNPIAQSDNPIAQAESPSAHCISSMDQVDKGQSGNSAYRYDKSVQYKAEAPNAIPSEDVAIMVQPSLESQHTQTSESYIMTDSTATQTYQRSYKSTEVQTSVVDLPVSRCCKSQVTASVSTVKGNFNILYQSLREWVDLQLSSACTDSCLTDKMILLKELANSTENLLIWRSIEAKLHQIEEQPAEDL